MWNDLKNSYKRADLQPALLLGIVMSQSSHGPFGSDHHQWTKQQTAEMDKAADCWAISRVNDYIWLWKYQGVYD